MKGYNRVCKSIDLDAELKNMGEVTRGEVQEPKESDQRDSSLKDSKPNSDAQ